MKTTRLMTALLIAMLSFIACDSSEEMQNQPQADSPKRMSILIEGMVDNLTSQSDFTKASLEPTITAMWAAGDKVYVYDATENLGYLTVDANTTNAIATLSGTEINVPTEGTRKLTLVYVHGATQAPEVNGGKLKVDFSDQTNGYPFVLYATLDYEAGMETITGKRVSFKYATSLARFNCFGLEEGQGIEKARISGVSTACELTLSASQAPTITGTEQGTITISGNSFATPKDGRAVFTAALVMTNAVSNGKVRIIMANGYPFETNFTLAKVDNSKSYNIVYKFEPFRWGYAEATTLHELQPTEPTTWMVRWIQLWNNGPKFAEYNTFRYYDKGKTVPKAHTGYFSWGGVNPYSTTDYNTGSQPLEGETDNVAYMWGSNWRLPTLSEFEDLLANCTVEWTTRSGVNGAKVTGKGEYADNSIFLPAGGWINTTTKELEAENVLALFWASTPGANLSAGHLRIDQSAASTSDDIPRGRARTLRAVLAE